jgi:hypothetical protein
MAFTDQDTFTAAFFWAWDLGPAGATATDGVSTGLLTAAAEAIAAVAAMPPTTAALPAAVGRFVEAARFAAMREQFVQAAMPDPA